MAALRLLGLKPGALPDDIHARYHHIVTADAAADAAAARMRELNEAYRLLVR